ncbi:hypothetical protein POSPLADRAFT_1045841 [Postia placenta MAD-698-R-SB12]|uniref:Uncharacterized protein n=1 Tax=Postia placenta MAD-698-R-SB12 TaxID=670580 RepID=A0A1X6N4R7_9APHY|nr:hypothetical protein POSPLADRAFT_1045841 [Postia placenta MAD-698-R-SB12]OSX63520.1 hypothetical protein POSPLADRAFT_1045841 [Postia placenta MAD-698-R-SB12]
MYIFLSQYTIAKDANAGVQLAAMERNPSVASLLQGATQPAVAGIRASRPSVRVHIVGYRAWSYLMYTHPERGGLTVEEAAIALTSVIRRAHVDLVGMICMPGGLQLGPMGITFEQLFLVEVHQVSRASIRLTLAYETST